jgi:4-hydroxy-3-methylbut-2-enyl diphosphate reductase
MEVIQIVPRGFCNGVVNAIQVAINTVKQYPNKRIGVLGMIVHNSYVVKMLEDLGIITYLYNFTSIDEVIDRIDVDIIILTAHGTKKDIITKLKNKNLMIVDTTCQYVKNTFELINEELDQGHEVIYLGVKNHPEAEASVNINPSKVHLIANVEDIADLKLNDTSPLIVNQTTISLDMITKLTLEILKVIPNARTSNEQCNATRTRQEAIINYAKSASIVFIVGDNKSNNTKELLNLGLKNNKETYLISDLDELDTNLLKDKKSVAISSGASTPNFITKQIIMYLKQFDYNDPSTYDKEKFKSIDYMKII